MSTPTSILSIEKTTAGATAGWATDIGGALDTLDRLSAGTNLFYVDKAFTAAALGNGDAATRRHFDTIQAAITASEGNSYVCKSTIIINSDSYFERLNITKSVTLFGAVPVNYFGQGGARGAEIRGDNTQNPVLTITPPAGGDIAVNLINLVMDNQYTGVATYINKPYLIDYRSDNTVNQVNYFGMLGCCCRNQTWGAINDWETAISLVGNLQSTIEGCTIANMNFGGGAGNGGIRKMFTVRGVYTGTPATNKAAFIQVRNCALQQSYNGAGATGVVALFDLNNGTTGRVVRTDLTYNTGSQTITGIIGTNTAIEGLNTDLAAGGNLNRLTFTI
jgi:hypothetical protein